MKKTLTAKLKEAIKRYSFFGKVEGIANKRRHKFNEEIPLLRSRVEKSKSDLREEPLNRDLDDALALDENVLSAKIRKREFWRNRYTWAHARHKHWGSVLKHRKDRLRRWIQQHEGFQPYMANGRPYEALTYDAKQGIYLAFLDGNYVTSTYEGYPGDGVHSTSSYHYLQNQPDGKARCWDAGAGTREPMVKTQKRQAEEFGSYLTESFGPENNLAYKNGVRFSLEEGSGLETMHDNHVHTDIRDGAFA